MNLLALLLLGLGAVVHQTEGLMIKKYNFKYKDGGMAFVSLIALFSMLFFVVTDRDGLCFTAELLPYGIVSGIIFAAASFMTSVALGCGSFVLTNLFLSYALLIPTMYGILLLNEPVSWITVVGLVMIAASIFFTRAVNDDGEDRGGERTSILWIVAVSISVVGSGAFAIMQKLQQVRFDQSADSEFMIITLATAAVLLFGIAAVKDGGAAFRTLRRGALYAPIAGISNGATNFINLTVNAMIPISIAAPSRSGVTIVVSFLIALLFFRERLSARQIFGVVIGIAALVLLNLKI